MYIHSSVYIYVCNIYIYMYVNMYRTGNRTEPYAAHIHAIRRICNEFVSTNDMRISCNRPDTILYITTAFPERFEAAP